MKEFITHNRIANSVMMSRPAIRCAIVLVEGSSDARFYNKHFDKLTRVIVAHSKSNVLKAILILEKNLGAVGVMGIIDCDYMVLEKELPHNPNIVYTDYHDLETLLLVSPSLENLLRELTPTQQLHLIDLSAERIRKYLFSFGAEIGYVRWINYREKLNLNFKSIPYSQIVNVDQMSIDIDSMLRKIINEENPTQQIDTIKEKIGQLKNLNADFKHVCQGHDLVSLLELIIPVVLDELFGIGASDSMRKKNWSSTLDNALRLGYEKAYFKTTKLYNAIKNWEKRNAPYAII